MSVPSLTIMDLADIGRNSASKGGTSGLQAGAAQPNAPLAPVVGRKPFAAMLAAQDQSSQEASQGADKTDEAQPANAAVKDDKAQADTQSAPGNDDVQQGDKAGQKQALQEAVAAAGDEPAPQMQNIAQKTDHELVQLTSDTLHGDGHTAQQGMAKEQSNTYQPSAGQTDADLQAALSIAAVFARHQQPASPSGASTSASAMSSATVTAMVAGGMTAFSHAQRAMVARQEGASASAKGDALASSMAGVLQGLSKVDAGAQGDGSVTARPMSQGAHAAGTGFAQAFTSSNPQGAMSLMRHEGVQAVADVLASPQNTVSSHIASSSASVQDMVPQGAENAVKAMSFQPASMAAAAAPSIMKAPSSPISAEQKVDPSAQGGGTNTMFDLLVKSSAQTGGQSLSSGGEQGGAAHEHASSEHTAQTEIAASIHEDDAGKAGLNVEGGSFLGLVSSHMEGSTNSAQIAGTDAPNPSHNVSQQQAQHVVGDKGSALQGGLATPSVLSARAPSGQAGSLTMTVTTSDDTSVHVQLNRSAEGLSSLALQGQDDGTTEALQKTHHILARQLDEAGLHAGVMKIDVLPTEAGQGAHGGEQNMPQQQSQHFGQNQGQNQQGQASFQQAGGFLAGGDGGAGQHHTSQQPRATGRTGQSERPQQDDTVYNPAGTAGGASGGMSRLNISV